MGFFWYEYKPPPIAAETIVNKRPTFTSFRRRQSWRRAANPCVLGALVHLVAIVQATGPQIGTWRSSLSRTDSGNGACELSLSGRFGTALSRGRPEQIAIGAALTLAERAASTLVSH